MRAASLALLAIACGTNAPEIPPELLAPEACDCPTAGYPQGETGTEEGDLLADAEFHGFGDPTGATVATPLQAIRFSDYFDPTGELGYDLLLINTTAVWCAVCQEAHAELPELYATYRAQGLVVLGLLFQDAAGDPATVEDLLAWTQAFGTNFPMALDPEFRMGLYGSAEALPLSIFVDAQTMVIQRKVTGGQLSTIRSYVSSELERSAAP